MKVASGRRALASLIAGHICLHASMAGMRMAAPLLALREGHSALAVGTLLALFALTQVFLALPTGRYVDRHGLRRPVDVGVTLAAVGACFSLILPEFEVMCLSALLAGAATGLVSISLQRHVGRLARDATELKQVFGWLSLGPALANFLGPFTAGLLIDLVGAWLGGAAGSLPGFRAAFLLMACLPLAGWLLMRRGHEPMNLPSSSSVAEAAPRRTRDLLRRPMLRRLLLVNLILAGCWDVHTFVVPVLGHEQGYSASVVGSLLGAFALAAAAVRVLMPLVAAHLREWVVISSAMLLAALVLAAYPLMPSALAMGICSVLLGLALGSVQPMVMSTLHQITPSDRQGEALGLRLMSLNGSSAVMPLLFGTLGAAVGVSVVFWAVSLSVGLGARLAWHLRPPASHQAGEAGS